MGVLYQNPATRDGRGEQAVLLDKYCSTQERLRVEAQKEVGPRATSQIQNFWKTEQFLHEGCGSDLWKQAVASNSDFQE